MKVLAFDTSTPWLSVAILDGEKTLVSFAMDGELRHSEYLTEVIEDALKYVPFSREELDLIAVGVGPGSYTGLRISLITAKILARSLDIPVIGVSGLSAMAYVQEDGLYLPALDARRKRVYWGLYRKTGQELEVLVPDGVTAVGELDIPPEAVVLGSGYGAYPELFGDVAHRVAQVTAEAIGRYGLHSYGKRGGDNPYSLEPNYVQKTQAMREYEERNGPIEKN
ncbi:MAG: tRNA (adenosine(37)-N6)-threonylcarbamoyltransferase complex dimerization subunit type 1 TsaB [Tissierellia bacterium]|nr:tRNA (adenosine(37)-N6)-threonylcarbamoyltransferase complex dimerization subunit type 1 TsaB [Tissierellia bacterium]